MTKNPDVLNLIKLMGSHDPDRRKQGRFILESMGLDFLKIASGGDLGFVQFIPSDEPILSLEKADLSGVDFSDCNLTKAWLGSANLNNANLSGAVRLHGAHFSFAQLGGVDFSHANLAGELDGRTSTWEPTDQFAYFNHALFARNDFTDFWFGNASLFRAGMYKDVAERLLATGQLTPNQFKFLDLH